MDHVFFFQWLVLIKAKLDDCYRLELEPFIS